MIVYVSSPYSGKTGENIRANVEKTQKYCRYVVDKGHTPIAPHLLFPQFMSEHTERERALDMALELVDVCQEIWFFSNEMTAGMQCEFDRALNNPEIVIQFIDDARGLYDR